MLMLVWVGLVLAESVAHVCPSHPQWTKLNSAVVQASQSAGAGEHAVDDTRVWLRISVASARRVVPVGEPRSGWCESVPRLNGMFAFVIWDTQSESLTPAPDTLSRGDSDEPLCRAVTPDHRRHDHLSRTPSAGDHHLPRPRGVSATAHRRRVIPYRTCRHGGQHRYLPRRAVSLPR